MRATSEYLCRSQRWIREKLSEIRHYRPPGGQILFREEDLIKYMDNYKVEPKEVDLKGMMSHLGLAPQKNVRRDAQ